MLGPMTSLLDFASTVASQLLPCCGKPPPYPGQQMCVQCWNARARCLQAERAHQPREPAALAEPLPPIVGKATGLDGHVGVVMNPPYLGGSKISSQLGNAYLKKLKRRYPGEAADLAAYFLRAVHQYYDVAYMGVLATNAISQGATRCTGLRTLVLQPVLSPDDGPDAERLPWLIRRAVKDVKWPGRARVTVSGVAMVRDCMPELCPMPFGGVLDASALYRHEGPEGAAVGEALSAEARLRQHSIGVDYTPPELGYDLVKPIVDMLGPDDVLVDPACGTGALFLYARDLGFEGRVLGFDVNAGALEVARKLFADDYEAQFVELDFLMAENAFEGLMPRVGVDDVACSREPQEGTPSLCVDDAGRPLFLTTPARKVPAEARSAPYVPVPSYRPGGPPEILEDDYRNAAPEQWTERARLRYAKILHERIRDPRSQQQRLDDHDEWLRKNYDYETEGG